MVDFNKIQKKWQKRWADKNIFKVKKDPKKKKFYCLEMFPYPSAYGMHMGHVRNYSMGDVVARYKRMQGFNVLFPMGYDALGLPAENAAIKQKSHPKKFTEKAIKIIMSQQKELGSSYDWSRMIATCYPDYYKWNQWFFLKFLEKGLAYRKNAPINWCPGCKTVLANEQVEAGKCWRCHSDVEIKQLEQWFLKITDYAEELLQDIKKLEWPERIKVMQENWIGKSKGTLINFKIKDFDKIIPIFTTRTDTLYGVTFMVYAPEHSDVMELVKGTKYEKKVKEFIKKVVIQERFTRTAEETEKEGMFIGRYAINPVTDEEIPIYIANFVLLEYGTGAVMAVPAHDQRDFEFAKKYNIPIRIVISPTDYELKVEKMSRAYVEDGVLVNSGEFNGMPNGDAIEDITKYLEKKGLGKFSIQYKLRDWLISRQRYWGTPIPVIYCNKCGIVGVLEKELPVLLPEDVKFTGEGNPLAKNESFVKVKCPKCGGNARRETDTVDTFFDSSWYFLRFCSPKYDKGAFDPKAVQYWMPVDQYIGGAEHAVMHLLYARFFCKVLRDLKLVKFDEPFTRLFNQGMLYKGGYVMSKSRGNIVTQDEISKKYGIDTARIYLLFISSPDTNVEWDDKGVVNSFRFLNKVFLLVEQKPAFKKEKELDSKDRKIISSMHKTIKKVTELLDELKFNLAIGAIMQFTSDIHKYGMTKVNKGVYSEAVETVALLMSPFCPHVAEEMWERLGKKGFISLEKWPKFDPKKIDKKAEAAEELVSQTVSDINAVLELTKIKKPKKITLFVADKWKYGLFKNVRKLLEKTRDVREIIKAVMIKEYGKEIAALIPRLVKDPSKIPETIIAQSDEINTLKSNREFLKEEFKVAEIEVINAEKSKEAKAKQAMPGKPALLLK